MIPRESNYEMLDAFRPETELLRGRRSEAMPYYSSAIEDRYMRKMPVRTLRFLAIVSLLPANIGAQVVEQQPLRSRQATIRTESTEVLVDAIVTDRKNRLITNLNPEDFLIYEDDVPQQLDSFRVYRGGADNPRGTQPTGTPATSTSLTPAPSRQMLNLTILLLDYSTTEFQNQWLVRDASIKYVEKRLRPNDLMAVLVLGAGLRFLTDFTNDKARLIAALRSKDLTGSAMAAERASLSSGIDAGQSPSSDNSDGIPSPSAALSGAGAGTLMAAEGASAQQVMLAQRIAAQYRSLRAALDQRQTREVLTAIRAIATGVKQIEGRKTLILFSQGFVVAHDIEEELHAVVGVANRSRLAVYPIDSRGLEAKELTGSLAPRDELTASASIEQRNRTQSAAGETIFDRTLQAGRDMRESALRYLANGTGGFLIRNTNDLGVGLARVDEEMRSYYLLSYRPTNQNFDGKFRQIRVGVRRPGLSVRARTGYYAIPSGLDFLTPEEFRIVEQSRSAAASEEMPLFVRAAGFLDERGEYRVPVVLEIPTRAIQFEDNGSIHSARLQIIGLIRDGTNQFFGRFGGRVRLDATKAEYKVLEPGNVSFLDTLQLPAGSYYSFEVAVKDLLSGKGSHRERGIYLHQPQPQLGLSTILLAKDVDKASNTTNQFLSVRGVKILPSARCQFRNGENLIFYFDIYRPQVQPDKKTDILVELALLRDGQRVSVQLPHYHLNETISESFPHLTVARYVQLTGLSPGNYALVVEVKDALANRAERAQTSFSVVN